MSGNYGRSASYRGGVTLYVLAVAVTAAIGGILFGFDIGVVGGVEAMYEFQEKFFPSIYERTVAGIKDTDPYCVYNDHKLQLFSSSMFLAGAVAAWPAGHATRAFGRKWTMVVGSLLFLVGAGLQAGAINITMLVLGRVVLGFGVGCATLVVPLYISEAAPYRSRGALTTVFQLSITVGILTAQLINYGLQWVPWGWRLSLGLAAVPAILLLLGGILLPDSPSSLIERGKVKEGRRVLELLRGTAEVDAEYADICEAAEVAARVSHSRSFLNLFRRRYLPMTIITSALAAFQQLSGINAIMFYVPLIFNSLGTGREVALLRTVIVGSVNVLSTFVSIVLVDRAGRRPLLLQGGVQMVAAMVAVAVTLGVAYQGHNSQDLSKGVAVLTLIFICTYVAAFAWSWGPLVWLIGPEVQVLETRAAGMSLSVFTNFIFSFIIGQFFLVMLCAFEWGVFAFFACWVVIMTAFVYFLLPETMGAPIENHLYLFARHPFWRRVMGAAADEVLQGEEFRKAAFQQAQRDHGDLRMIAAYYRALGLGPEGPPD